jgi:dTDP-4-dehydrorhamnose reductase
MSTSELKRPNTDVIEYYRYLSTKEIINEMQRVAPPNQSVLDYTTYHTLNDLTSRLLELEATTGVAEYDYYLNTQNRELSLPEDKLLEQIQGRTVLVSGGTGLIGSNLMKELSKYHPDRMVSLSRGKMLPHILVPGVEYIGGDVRDAYRVHQVMWAVKPDIVYHVAADKYNHEAESRAFHTLSTNINGTKNMLEAAEAAGVSRFVYASTGKATRPYSPDIYASSKKTGELLLAKAAARGKMACAAGRFTHVVDGSSLVKKFENAIQQGGPVRVHNPDSWFYVQSAKESAQLLLNAGLEAETNMLKIQAIRDLKTPVNLAKFSIGAVAKSGSRVPIYFQGVEPGYEETAWPGLYHPLTAMEVGPLVSSLEADSSRPSITCPEIDSFPLEFQFNRQLERAFQALKSVLDNPGSDVIFLKKANRELSWAILDARLDKLPTEVLEPIYMHASSLKNVNSNSEHDKVNLAINQAINRKKKHN